MVAGRNVADDVNVLVLVLGGVEFGPQPVKHAHRIRRVSQQIEVQRVASLGVQHNDPKVEGRVVAGVVPLQSQRSEGWLEREEGIV